MKNVIFFFLLCLKFSSLQPPYVDACQKLRAAAFEGDTIDTIQVEGRLRDLIEVLNHINQNEYEACNCADSLWIAILNDHERVVKQFYPTTIDKHSYLRHLVSRMDIINLDAEFRLHDINSLKDSFQYVLERLSVKEERRDSSPYHWMCFYHCVEAESTFFKQNRKELMAEYLAVFDDTTSTDQLKRMLMHALYYSDVSIESEIFERINISYHKDYFFMLIAVLGTSGGSESVGFLTRILEEKTLDLPQKKMILNAINRILYYRGKNVKRKYKTNYKRLLKNAQLDTIEVYNHELKH